MFQDIFIIGATGKVGKELVSQILLSKDSDMALHKNPTRIVGVASSTSYLYDQNGLAEGEVTRFSQKQLSGKVLASVLDIVSFVSQKNEVVFIDVTAEKEVMLRFHQKVMRETRHKIVTANKNPLVLCSTKEFRELTKERSRYGYRCSVMAGAEAVNKMLDLYDLNDKPLSIEGCFSGTLGFLSSELENGKKLSDALVSAMRLGYTEPNPVVDLSGEDVARKMLILVRSAGYEFNYEEIEVIPFIEKEVLESQSVDALLKKIKKEDDRVCKSFSEAKKKGSTFRYVGSFDAAKNSIVVKLRKVPLQSPLGQLKGTSNKIVVVTKTYTEEKPYIVESPGAGLAVTAQNVRRDLLSLITYRTLAHSE